MHAHMLHIPEEGTVEEHKEEVLPSREVPLHVDKVFALVGQRRRLERHAIASGIADSGIADSGIYVILEACKGGVELVWLQALLGLEDHVDARGDGQDDETHQCGQPEDIVEHLDEHEDEGALRGQLERAQHAYCQSEMG